MLRAIKTLFRNICYISKYDLNKINYYNTERMNFIEDHFRDLEDRFFDLQDELKEFREVYRSNRILKGWNTRFKTKLEKEKLLNEGLTKANKIIYGEVK